MSRNIDLGAPLSDEDKKYLADRDRTVEDEEDLQAAGFCEDIRGVIGDPRRNPIMRKARQIR